MLDGNSFTNWQKKSCGLSIVYSFSHCTVVPVVLKTPELPKLLGAKDDARNVRRGAIRGARDHVRGARDHARDHASAAVRGVRVFGSNSPTCSSSESESELWSLFILIYKRPCPTSFSTTS